MKTRILVVLALVIVGVAFGISIISSKQEVENTYRNYIVTAREYAFKDVPYTAIENYDKAFEIRADDEALYMEYLEQCKKIGEDFYADALQGYAQLFPLSSNAYEQQCLYYYANEEYSKAIEKALAAREAGIATEAVKEIYYQCAYRYRYIRTALDEAYSYVGDTAIIKEGDSYGYLSDTGIYTLAPGYDAVSAFVGDGAMVYEDSQWYMINKSGYVIGRPSAEADGFSLLNNGKIRVQKGQKFGYADAKLNVPTEFPYDKASNFKLGVAAVCKDGKWALINSEEQNITDYIYDDVLLDENDTCYNGGVVFAKKDGKYYMYDGTGNQIGTNGFDAAYPFAGNYPAAVKIGEKWGFVDAQGNMVIEPEYDAAKSFNIGLGAVCKDGVWGYISEDNIYRIPATFSDCRPFSGNGIAAVQESGSWSYIKLYAYIK